MDRHLHSLVSAVLAHRWTVVAASLAAALLLGAGALSLETDNSPRIFFVEGSPGVERYEVFRDTFGSDKVVRLVVRGDGLWTRQGLALLGELEEGAAAVEGVAEASGLRGHYRRLSPEWPPPEPGAFRRRAEADPLNRELGWLGREGETATVLVTLGVTGNRDKERVLARLEELAREAGGAASEPAAGVTVEVAGSAALDRALDASSREIGRRYFPLLVGLAVLLLWSVFRSWRDVFLPLAFVAVSELALFGAMGWAGVELNLVLVILAPLVFVIALATAVHVLVRWRDFTAAGKDAAEAVVETYRDKGWAVVWTGLSTLVGFASLTVSRVGPVSSFGVWAAVGIAGLTILAFTLYPALLAGGSGGRAVERGRFFEHHFRHRGRRWAEAAARRRWAVIAAVTVLAGIAAAGLPRLAVETNALEYLRPEHPARAAVERLEAAGIGTVAVEVVLRAAPDGRGGEEVAAGGERAGGGPEGARDADGGGAGEGAREPGAFETFGSLERLSRLSERLRGLPHVLSVVGPGDVLADAERLAPGSGFFGRRTARRMVLDRLLGEAEEGEGPLARLLAEDGDAARLTVFTETIDHGAMEELRAEIEAAATAELPGARVETTGELPLILETQRELLETLGLSLTLTLAAIAVIFRLLLGSTRLTLLAMVPNLWPVVGILGVMGWSGVPLDVATVMVASVVLGLAVDDTIHTLGHFRELAPRHGRFEAVAGTLEVTAPAYVLTGLLLAAGFGVCALSDFAPTQRFGALSAVAIALAVAGDLWLLPAILGSTPQGAVAKMGRRAGRGREPGG